MATALLAFLRDQLGRSNLRYREPPRRLTGGYFTENHVFRLETDIAEWSPPLVLRLFPSDGPSELARREAAVQRVVVAQGLLAPPVLHLEDSVGVLGRRFLIMELLPGRALMGGVETGALFRARGRMLLRLPRILAETQAELHRLDPAPLVDALGALPAGIDRWLGFLAEEVETRAPELRPGLEWLVDHKPAQPARVAICHGDLWPGNLLVDRGRVTGVLDWSLATVADPAFDVGCTAMAFIIAPMDVPTSVARVALPFSRAIARRFVAAYRELTGADLSNQPWYEALRCLWELTEVVDYRRADAEGRARDIPRPTWDRASERTVAFFTSRTGVHIPLPAPVQSVAS